MKMYSSEIKNNKEIILNILNKMDNILINKQTINTETNIQNAETNKEVSFNLNTQNGFREINVPNVKLIKVINFSFDV